MTERLENTELSQQQLTEIGDFVISLIQTILRTGYYTEASAEMENSLNTAYAQFRKIISGHNEISFIIEKTVRDRDPELMIEGLCENQLPLRELAGAGKQELYLPKFMAYFERSNLASFAIKSDIPSAKFGMFLHCLRSPELIAKADSREKENKFTKLLIEHNLTEISTVFNEELNKRGRKVSWRVELALKRLLRDIKMVPLYRDISEEKKAQLKTQILRDIVRPLRQPVLMADILVHIDLIDLSETDFAADEMIDEIVALIPPQMLIQTTRNILKSMQDMYNDWLHLSLEEIKVEDERLSKLIMLLVKKKLADLDPEETWELYDEIIREGILRRENAPVSARTMIEQKEAELRMKEASAVVIEHGAAHFTRLGPDDLTEETFGLLDHFSDSIPYLLFHGNFDIVLAVYDKLAELRPLAGDKRDRLDQYFIRARSAVYSPETARKLVDLFDEASKEMRTRFEEIFTTIGGDIYHPLIDLLAKSEKIPVRRHIVSLLVANSDQTRSIVLNHLGRIDNEWHLTRNLLLVAKEIGDASFGGVLSHMVNDANPQIRASALDATPKVFGPAAFNFLIAALGDAEAEIRAMALTNLINLGCKDSRYITFLLKILVPTDREEGYDEKMMNLALAGLTKLQNFNIDKETRLDQYLILLIKKVADSGIKGKGAAKTYPPSVLQGLYKTLGKIGDRATADFLAKALKKEKGADIQPVIKQALEDIAAKKSS